MLEKEKNINEQHITEKRRNNHQIDKLASPITTFRTVQQQKKNRPNKNNSVTIDHETINY